MYINCKVLEKDTLWFFLIIFQKMIVTKADARSLLLLLVYLQTHISLKIDVDYFGKLYTYIFYKCLEQIM
jgi:hypothetical protein